MECGTAIRAGTALCPGCLRGEREDARREEDEDRKRGGMVDKTCQTEGCESLANQDVSGDLCVLCAVPYLKRCLETEWGIRFELEDTCTTALALLKRCYVNDQGSYEDLHNEVMAFLHKHGEWEPPTDTPSK